MATSETPPRFYRSANDRMIAGLAGGLAELLRVDSAWVRLGLVTLVLLGCGSPLLVYLIAWLIVPGNPVPGDLTRNRLHRSPTERVLGGVCGGMAVTWGIDPVLVRLGFLGLMFVGIGVLIYPVAWWILPLGQPATERPL